jgi:hypothetical protein
MLTDGILTLGGRVRLSSERGGVVECWFAAKSIQVKERRHRIEREVLQLTIILSWPCSSGTLYWKGTCRCADEAQYFKGLFSGPKMLTNPRGHQALGMVGWFGKRANQQAQFVTSSDFLYLLHENRRKDPQSE